VVGKAVIESQHHRLTRRIAADAGEPRNPATHVERGMKMRRCKLKGSDTVHIFNPTTKKTLCGKKYKPWKFISTIKEVDCPDCIEKS
jgi:hypothetical protein